MAEANIPNPGFDPTRAELETLVFPNGSEEAGATPPSPIALSFWQTGLEASLRSAQDRGNHEDIEAAQELLRVFYDTHPERIK